MAEERHPHRPTTVFEFPQAQLRPDSRGRRFYGNVDNALSVTQYRREFTVALAVPTVVFIFMKQVCKVPPDSSVTLGLDLVGDFYVFSLLAGDNDLYDLWPYTKASAPPWVFSREYQC